MKYLIVYAHPEPRSLNGALKDAAVAALEAAGHEVRVSDLYAMKWKAVADADDFPQRDPQERLVYHRASGDAYHGGTQSPEVADEQAKLLWADAVVLQFPLWWFSMPAIMKGWVDRVFAHGFAIGVAKPGTKQWARYGEGSLAGRRGMVAITTGAREAQLGPRGLNGDIEDLLFPIAHGTLFYVGLGRRAVVRRVPDGAAERRAVRGDLGGICRAAARDRRGRADPVSYGERRRLRGFGAPSVDYRRRLRRLQALASSQRAFTTVG